MCAKCPSFRLYKKDEFCGDTTTLVYEAKKLTKAKVTGVESRNHRRIKERVLEGGRVNEAALMVGVNIRNKLG